VPVLDTACRRPAARAAIQQADRTSGSQHHLGSETFIIAFTPVYKGKAMEGYKPEQAASESKGHLAGLPAMAAPAGQQISFLGVVVASC
jgi:hypothetical protein